MKKFLIVFIIVILSFTLLVATVGCTKNISSITDVKRFADMQKTADKIEVDFENGRPGGFKFTITDEGEIEEVMNALFSSTLHKESDGARVPPGANTVIRIYQGEKMYKLNQHYVFENGSLYHVSNELGSQIYKLARAHGAFDDEE